MSSCTCGDVRARGQFQTECFFGGMLKHWSTAFHSFPMFCREDGGRKVIPGKSSHDRRIRVSVTGCSIGSSDWHQRGEGNPNSKAPEQAVWGSGGLLSFRQVRTKEPDLGESAEGEAGHNDIQRCLQAYVIMWT